MGDDAVIVSGVDSELSEASLYSTVHGAGRVMSRTAARGKFVKDENGKKQRQPGLVRHDEWQTWLRDKGVLLSGGDLDEAPQAYRRLPDVLAAHAGTAAAHAKAKARKEAEDEKEGRATNKVRDGADKLDDLWGLISDLGPGAIAALATKTLGERVGVAKDAAKDLRDKLVDRYGERGATAIVIAGIAGVKALDFIVPGAGTLMSFVPGSHLVAALPVAAAVETAKCVGESFCEAARQAGQLMSALAGLAGGGASKPKELSPKEKAAQRKKKQARMSADDGGGKDEGGGKGGKGGKGQGGLSDEQVEKLGRKYMKALTGRIVRDLMAHIDTLKEIGEAIKKGKKGKKDAKDKDAKDKD
jgi:hypothetical protein